MTRKESPRLQICQTLLAILAFLCLAGISRVANCAEPPLKNGDFSRWTEGLPAEWLVEIGARNGAEQPVSEITRIKGPALLLQGDGSTMAWRTLSQELAVQPGQACRLSFESASKNVRREGRQFDNCYVGIVSLDANGQPVGREMKDLSTSSDGWVQSDLQFVVPANADTTKVMIFLSKSGMLGVRNLTLTVTGAAADSPTVSQATTEADTGSLVSNGRFLEWSSGHPDGWVMEIGARNGGNEPTSIVEPADQGGVTLRGDRSTMAWYSLSQELDLQPGATYTLVFQARTSQVRQEQGQYDNCYVGVMSLDGGGQRLDMAIKNLSGASRLQQQRVNFRVPDQAASTRLLIFLSKTGLLTVKSVSVEEATPERPFRGTRG